ncbi:MAG: NADH:ubiquinone oxidoreductase [Synergistaceae bacterium]|nr:NADH:ubiquinone oxidoreductase [Synergistaceae bacterium]
MNQHLPALLLALPIGGAFLAPLACSLGKKLRNIFYLTVSLLTLICAVMIFLETSAGKILVYVMGAENFALTLPSGMAFPVRIILEMDAFSGLMVLCVAIASFAGALFSVNYMDKFSGLKRFISLYFLLVLGALGMCATGDLFNFFVFVEISSIASYGLAAFWRDKPESIEASFKYMMLSQVGALLLLVAVGTLYGKYNAINIGALASMLQTGVLEKIVLAMFIAILAFKCGAFPMHAWLPDVYSEAPSGVTCLLVSVSQASFYGLMRICFTLYGTNPANVTAAWILITLGCASMFFGVMMAVIQHDVKRLMGYHSISQVGYMLLAMGVGLYTLSDAVLLAEYGFTAMKGGIFHLFNYSMFKGLLFLTAGALYYATGTRDLDKMGGLARSMPWTTVMFMIGAAAISGLPPFSGFASKWLIYESSFAIHPILPVVALLTSILTLASFVKVFQTAFLGASKISLAPVREVPVGMLCGMGLLSILILFVSFFPNIFVSGVADPSASGLIDQAGYINAVLGGVK